MEGVHEEFTNWDWGVVAGYLVLTTVIGHALRGRQATVKDFFLAGRSLPWPAVSGSIIATEISALTFIGVPGTVYALQGDFTYLQWGIGSILARFIVGYFLIPLYYEREVFSPYDYMGQRLGEGVKKLVTVLFSLGAVLGQSVRVLVTAIILKTVTGMPMWGCIAVIGVFAMIWTLMGGMRTVIWTDVIQFGVFIFGGILALGWLLTALGWDTIVALNAAVETPGGVINKMRWFDATSPFEDPALRYTIWVAILAMPFQNVAAFGTDQLNTQRMFCCRNAREARKAVVWSSVSQVITLMMLLVGAGLFAWYRERPPGEAAAALFAEDPNFVFPVWITTVLPAGIKGLIIAGAFAAAVSSLDSILAALSQTTLSMIFGKERLSETAHERRMVRLSRGLVVLWAALLVMAALLLSLNYEAEGDRDLIGLAFRMVAYVYGPLLGILILAIAPWPRSTGGLVAGTILSIAVAAWAQPDIYRLAQILGWIDAGTAERVMPELSSMWFYPINTFLTVGCGVLGGLLGGRRVAGGGGRPGG